MNKPQLLQKWWMGWSFLMTISLPLSAQPVGIDATEEDDEAIYELSPL